MNRHILRVAALSLAIASPAIGDVLPEQVVFEGGAVSTSLTGRPGDPAEGARIYASKALGNCVACHVVAALPDAQWQGNVGPALDGAADRWSEAELRGIVANAKMMFPGSRMPAFYKTTGFIRPGDGFSAKPAPKDYPPILSAGQIEDVVAFLMTLRQ